jgi:uncharacterized membrane protein
MPSKKNSFITRLPAIARFGIALAAAGLAFAVEPADWSGSLRFLVTWDLAAAVYVVPAWMLIVQSDPSETRLHARSQDVAASAIFVVVLAAAFACTAAIGLLLSGARDLDFWPKALHVALSVVALLAAWFLIHTVYSFHYARRFYSSKEDPEAEPRGLNFPGRGNPDYFDFAYYSFVVGMTSQVSDVSINAHHMRRLTLIHGILSFIFNVAILALSVNIIVSVL